MIWFDIPQLTNPDFMNPKLYTQGINELTRCIEFMERNKDGETEKEFQGFSDFEIKKVQRLIDWIIAPTEFDVKKASKNFHKFFEEHDKRRSTDFLTCFPEMENFWMDCANG